MSSTIKVRFLVDREQERVVLAEAGSDFVDVLFSFLTLPLGRIIRLLNKQSGLGSLDSLYKSIERLDTKHLQTEACKEMLLDPRSAAAVQCENLKIKGIHEEKPRTIYTCSQEDCLIHSTCYYTYISESSCSRCGKVMDKVSEWVPETSGEGGIFVNDKDNFMITDDLRITRTSLVKGLSIFKEMQILEASMLEERVVDFGTEEALILLGRSLVSKNALTKVCFPDAPVQASARFSLPIKEEIVVKEAEKEIIVNKDENEINLNLILNKEKNNVLCAEVGEDFVNLMFSFLTIPLGSVLQVFSDNISLGGCIKNLYSSAESMGFECFKSEISRNMLLTPKLPTFYGYNKKQILHLEEFSSEKLIVSKGCIKCYFDNNHKPCTSAPCKHEKKHAEVIEWNPKSSKIMGDASDAFVVGSNLYMITDNLQISPLSIISAVGSEMNSSISDMVVKEVSFDKGKARSLLGAMFISKTVLTDVFSPKPTRRKRSL